MQKYQTVGCKLNGKTIFNNRIKTSGFLILKTLRKMHVVKNQYSISTDKSKLQLFVIHHFLSNESYWAAGITMDEVLIRIENSLCFGVYFNEEQIGFARIITDYTSFAYLADVFIVKEHRGKGLSKWLMQIILAMNEFKNIKRFLLATRDMHALYEKFGFIALQNPERFMELPTKNKRLSNL